MASDRAVNVIIRGRNEASAAFRAAADDAKRLGAEMDGVRDSVQRAGDEWILASRGFVGGLAAGAGLALAQSAMNMAGRAAQDLGRYMANLPPTMKELNAELQVHASQLETIAGQLTAIRAGTHAFDDARSKLNQMATIYEKVNEIIERTKWDQRIDIAFQDPQKFDGIIEKFLQLSGIAIMVPQDSAQAAINSALADLQRGAIGVEEFTRRLVEIDGQFPGFRNVIEKAAQAGDMISAHLERALEIANARIQSMAGALPTLTGAGPAGLGGIEFPDLGPYGAAPAFAIPDTAGDMTPASPFPDAPRPRNKPNFESFAPSKGRSGKSEIERQAEREREAIRRVTEELRFQEAQLARSEEQQDVYLQLKRAGIGLETAQGKEIEKLTLSIREKEKALEEAKKAQEEMNHAMEYFGNMGLDAFDAMATGGRDLSDVLQSLSRDLLRMAAQAALFGNGPLAGLLGMQAGGGLLSLLKGGLGIGGASQAGPLNLLAGMRMYATGTNYVPNTGPAILHEGEIVLPRGISDIVRKGGSGQGGMTLNVINQAPGVAVEKGKGPDGNPAMIIRSLENTLAGRMARGQGALARIQQGQRFKG